MGGYGRIGVYRVMIKAHSSHLQGSWKIDLEEATCRSHVIGQVAFTPGSECCGTIYIISPASKSSFYTQQLVITTPSRVALSFT